MSPESSPETIDTNVPEFAPGCFGSALAYRETDSICTACVFAGRCKPLHLQAQAALRARFGIELTETQKRRIQRAANPPAHPAEMTVPKKVQALIDRFDNTNSRVAEQLGQGVNPFATTLPFMRIVCHLLLNYAKPIDRGLLATAFASRLNWQQDTAEAHARMAIQALTHIGAVDNIDGAIALRRIG
ncbi:hypothetical protein [Ancylobacter rudongensis]|uniref:Uncharacterized protein n=1 Tax=Ancylobacter rudongensis TaxID=177413 RepID=A0A1G4UQ62_9HYPH|nr:hypothetical protein [Ancylobacter rudongensis]SCW95770.1 hypothetical protein SAMN05660859_0113 [Ancylobacter rudongensis]